MVFRGAVVPTLSYDEVVYRAYSRAVDQRGRVKDQDFKLRDSEFSLSVALTPEKVMGALKCKGYVALSVGKIRDIGRGGKDCLEVIIKTRCDNQEEDSDLWQIVGIPCKEEIRISLSMELARIAETPSPRT